MGLIDPFLKVRYISTHGKRPANTPRLIILHTNAGASSSTGANLWSFVEGQLAAGNTGVTQPHYQCDLDGTLWRFLDESEKGVASYRAEGFCISIETQDYGSKQSSIEVQPWTPAQIESLARVCADAHVRWGVPLRWADAWDGSGIGHHTMWGAPSNWTTVRGKTCPGAARKAQVPQIIARAIELVTPLPPPPPPPLPFGDDDMIALIRHSSGAVVATNGTSSRGMTQETLNWIRLVFKDQLVNGGNPIDVSDGVWTVFHP